MPRHDTPRHDTPRHDRSRSAMRGRDPSKPKADPRGMIESPTPPHPCPHTLPFRRRLAALLPHPAKRFRFNPDFEYELSALPTASPPQAKAITEAFASVMELLALPGDRMLTHPLGQPSHESVQDFAKHSYQDVAQSDDESNPKGVQARRGFPPSHAGLETAHGLPSPRRLAYLPWGVTPRTIAEARRLDAAGELPPLEAVTEVNNRCFSVALEERLGVGLAETRILASEEEIRRYREWVSGPIVIKHPFGVAGRERIRCGRELTPGHLRWCRRKLASSPVLIAEPWVPRLRDWSVQLWIPREGSPILLGILELLARGNGQWRGHRTGVHSPPPDLGAIALDAAERVRDTGYFGPLGIDAFVFVKDDGTTMLRPLVELNGRITMGLCALGLLSGLPPDRTAMWEVLSGVEGDEGVEDARRRPFDRDAMVGSLLVPPFPVDGGNARGIVRFARAVGH